MLCYPTEDFVLNLPRCECRRDGVPEVEFDQPGPGARRRRQQPGRPHGLTPAPGGVARHACQPRRVRFFARPYTLNYCLDGWHVNQANLARSMHLGREMRACVLAFGGGASCAPESRHVPSYRAREPTCTALLRSSKSNNACTTCSLCPNPTQRPDVNPEVYPNPNLLSTGCARRCSTAMRSAMR